MIRVDARPTSAKVIEVEVLGDRADEDRVDDSTSRAISVSISASNSRKRSVSRPEPRSLRASSEAARTRAVMSSK
jgi:hypothetical protein